MLTKIDKAWVTAAVAFAALTASTFFEFQITDAMQAGIASLVLGVITWAIPNKA